MNSLRLIKALSSKIHTRNFLRFRQKSTSTTSTNTTEPSLIPNENITVWNVYGPPFVNCFLIGSITYVSLHVIWYKLAFIELQEEMENKISELENRIEYLKKNKNSSG
jgi:hypothetical protein